jgi:hypothetical protein
MLGWWLRMSCKVGRCEALTSHTRGLGGFCGPGGSVVDGRCSRGSREAAGEDGPPLGGEYCSICRGVGGDEGNEGKRAVEISQLLTFSPHSPDPLSLQ